MAKTYRELEQELNEILNRSEQSVYDDVDSMIKDYDKGMKIVKELESMLKEAKNKISKIK